MTINVPIRPGAALTDPETYRYVGDEILNKKYTKLDRRERMEFAYDKEGFLNILANYPWQEYGYKYGRWERENFFDGTSLDILPVKSRLRQAPQARAATASGSSRSAVMR